jgi:ATP-dependent protease ClpP protease subunit
MFALHDIIRSCTNEIITIGTGEICSAAGLLLVAGDKSYATKNCWFMAHEGTFDSGLESNLAIESRAAINNKRSKQWAALMADHTEPNEKWWIDNAIENKRELWLSAKQMKQQQYKIIDDTWPLE